MEFASSYSLPGLPQPVHTCINLTIVNLGSGSEMDGGNLRKPEAHKDGFVSDVSSRCPLNKACGGSPEMNTLAYTVRTYVRDPPGSLPTCNYTIAALYTYIHRS